MTSRILLTLAFILALMAPTTLTAQSFMVHKIHFLCMSVHSLKDSLTDLYNKEGREVYKKQIAAGNCHYSNEPVAIIPVDDPALKFVEKLTLKGGEFVIWQVTAPEANIRFYFAEKVQSA